MRLGGIALGVLLTLAPVLSACGPKTMNARLKDSERRSDDARDILDEAQKHAEALEPDRMESALKDAKKRLDSPDINLYPEAGFQQDRYAELTAQLPAVRAAREKKDLEGRLDRARDKVVPRVRALREAMEAFSLATVTAQQLSQLDDRASDVKKGVDEELDLFVKDKDFAEWAKGQRANAERAEETVATGRRALAFIDGPLAAQMEATRTAATGRAEKKPADRLAWFAKAREGFTVCEAGALAAAKDEALARVVFQQMGGAGQTPAHVASTCNRSLKQTLASEKLASTAAKKADDAEKRREAAKKKAEAAAEKRAEAAQKKKEAAQLKREQAKKKAEAAAEKRAEAARKKKEADQKKRDAAKKKAEAEAKARAKR